MDVTSSSGTGELHKGHGVAFADLDHDGDEEIVFEVGGATPGDAHALRLFENPGHRNDWLTLKLVGVKTNRAAIGARITVTVDGAGGRRDHSSHGEQRRVVWRLAAAAAHRPRRECPSGRGRDLVADQQHPAAVFERRQEPVRRDDGVRRQLPSGAADAAAAAGRERQCHITIALGRSLRFVAVVLVALAATVMAPAAQQPVRHAMRGMVLKVDAARKTVFISHDPREGVMPAMTMPFEVRDAKELTGLVPGAIVSFSLVLAREFGHIEQIKVIRYQSVEQDPAGRPPPAAALEPDGRRREDDPRRPGRSPISP